MSENPLFDGNLSVTIGALDVTAALLPGLSYSNTNPGGFGEATMRLPATDPWGPYDAAVVKGAAVVIAHDGTTLFEGEITNDVSHATVESGTAYYDVTAAGLWWKAGQRGDFCRVCGDDDPGQWFELGSGGPFQVDTDGKVEIRFEVGQSTKAYGSKSLYYWLDGGMGDPDSEITHVLGFFSGRTVDQAGPVEWHASLSSSDSPWGSWTAEYTWSDLDEFTATSEGIAVTAGAKALRLRLWCVQASTGITLDRYISMSDFSVITNALTEQSITNTSVANPTVLTCAGHGLVTNDRVHITQPSSVATSASTAGWHDVTRINDNTFSVPVNVVSVADGTATFFASPRLDDALVSIAVTTGLASTSDSASIGSVNWGLNVRPHMSRAEAIESLAVNHPAAIDYGFWDSATFYCKERIAAAGTRDILIDSSLPGIDFDVFANTEESPTHVKVLYTFRDVDNGSSVYPDGTLAYVYRPSAPATWSDASVPLEVWDEWADLVLETSQAENLGDQILAWISSNQYVGTVTISAPTVPVRGGGTRTTAYLRAGDYIEDTNLDTGPLQISSVDVDVDGGVVTLGVGESRSEFVARISPRAASRFDRVYGPDGHPFKRRH